MQVSTIDVTSIRSRKRQASEVVRQGEVEPTKWDRMEVILKVAERCNIDCSYCYFFNGGDESYASHPAYITEKTVAEVAAFLAKTARDSNLQELQIDFHGGEPLMLKKSRFEAMCRTLYSQLDFIPTLRLAMQTNAMLIDDEWVALFAKYDIAIGVSLDGPADYNDAFRVDHRGRGTYAETVAGIKKLKEAHSRGILKLDIALICVANPAHDPVRTLSHFVDDVGVTTLDFAFPMFTHDNATQGQVAPYTEWMVGLFDEWVRRNDQRIRIRFIDKLMSLLIGGVDGLKTYRGLQAMNAAFTISSNGELGAPDDDRIATYAFGTGVMASESIGLSDFYATPPLKRFHEGIAARGEKCGTCCWGNVCDGGEAIASNTQRYSRANGFANPSVFCDAISELLARMVEFIVGKGIDFEHIEPVLIADQTTPAERMTS